MNQVTRVFAPQPLPLPAAIDGFLAACRAKNLSLNTQAYYSYRLGAFLKFLDGRNVDTATIREFLTREQQTNSATTAQHSYCALRAFFNHCEREGELANNPMERVDKPKRRQTLIPTLSAEQVERLLATCDRSFYGVRDRAVILLMFDTGARVSELCGLEPADVSLDTQVMRVLGKGDIERRIPFGGSARQALTGYMARLGELDTHAVFVNHYAQPLTPKSVQVMLKARGKAAGIDGVRVSPHTLRHSMAVAYLRNGGDVFSLQRILGHASLTMTRRYCELSQTDVVDKHRTFSPGDRLGIKTTTGRRRLK